SRLAAAGARLGALARRAALPPSLCAAAAFGGDRRAHPRCPRRWRLRPAGACLMALGDLLRHATLQKFARHSLLRMEAETAHKATLNALKFGLVPAGAADPANLAMRFLGLDLSNPLGMAAGFDKNAEVPAPLMRMGMGFV